MVHILNPVNLKVCAMVYLTVWYRPCLSAIQCILYAVYTLEEITKFERRGGLNIILLYITVPAVIITRLVRIQNSICDIWFQK